MIRKSLFALLAATLAVALSPLPSYAAKKSKAGSCGTFMYYAKGKCVDARITPVKK